MSAKIQIQYGYSFCNATLFNTILKYKAYLCLCKMLQQVICIFRRRCYPIRFTLIACVALIYIIKSLKKYDIQNTNIYPSKQSMVLFIILFFLLFLHVKMMGDLEVRCCFFFFHSFCFDI